MVYKRPPVAVQKNYKTRHTTGSSMENTLEYIDIDDKGYKEWALKPDFHNTGKLKIKRTCENAGRHRFMSSGDSPNEINIPEYSETISIIDAVAKTLCGDSQANKSNSYSVSNRRFSNVDRLPPITVTQEPRHPSGDASSAEITKTFSHIDTDSPVFISRGNKPQDMVVKGHYERRRNSLMVPLVSQNELSPLIPSPRQRSHSLSPLRAPIRLSPLNVDSQTQIVHPKGEFRSRSWRRRLSIQSEQINTKSITHSSTGQNDFPKCHTRTDSSLDLV